MNLYSFQSKGGRDMYIYLQGTCYNTEVLAIGIATHLDRHFKEREYLPIVGYLCSPCPVIVLLNLNLQMHNIAPSTAKLSR